MMGRGAVTRPVPPCAMATRLLNWLLLLLGVACAAAAAGWRPIHCPQDDQLEPCLSRAILTTFDRLIIGIPEAEIPPLEVLKIPKIKIKRKAGALLDIRLSLLDVLVKDILTNATVKSVKFKPDKYDLVVKTHRPAAQYSGRYSLKGKLLWLPVWGNGTFTFKMKNIADQFRIAGREITKEDGKKYWEVLQTNATLQPQEMTMHFDNLYGGVQQSLSSAALTLINSQWRLIYRYVKSAADSAYSKEMKQVWKKLFLYWPFEEIFPPK